MHVAGGNSYHFAAARADHERQYVVAGLEDAAHNITIDAHCDMPTQAGGARQRVPTDAQPGPSSHLAALEVHDVGRGQEQHFSVGPAPVRGERGGGIGASPSSRCAATLRRCRSPARSGPTSCANRQDAGKLGASASASSAVAASKRRDPDCPPCPPSTPMPMSLPFVARRRPAHRKGQPRATKPSVAASFGQFAAADERQRGGPIAVRFSQLRPRTAATAVPGASTRSTACRDRLVWRARERADWWSQPSGALRAVSRSRRRAAHGSGSIIKRTSWRQPAPSAGHRRSPTRHKTVYERAADRTTPCAARPTSAGRQRPRSSNHMISRCAGSSKRPPPRPDADDGERIELGVDRGEERVPLPGRPGGGGNAGQRNIRMVSMVAITGLVADSPDSSLISFDIGVVAPHRRDRRRRCRRIGMLRSACRWRRRARPPRCWRRARPARSPYGR